MTLNYFYGQAGKLFSFYRIPKALFQEQRFQNLSTDAKTLYGILLDRMSLSVKNEWFDKQGRVFIIFTIEDVKRALCCADNKATKLLRELENFGLIERKRRGLGKPSLVYVKNFSSDLSNERVQNRENHESGSPKNACQDPPKSRCNKNKKSKTERNNTNPILSDELEEMKNRKLLEEYFSRSLEIELLLRLYPDDEDADQWKRYEIFQDTLGGRPYLFNGGLPPGGSDGSGTPGIDYQVPAEALTDSEFAAIYKEAQKYVGTPYVWGGSTPETGFDCSGYVCWVYNQNGYDVGRTTANGLWQKSQHISEAEAKPGDLVFFKGTYDTPGMSHTGIYLGNGMMVSAGDPIKYANIHSSYWEKHLAGFGRLSK